VIIKPSVVNTRLQVVTINLSVVIIGLDPMI
jgi:hypothetical protein